MACKTGFREARNERLPYGHPYDKLADPKVVDATLDEATDYVCSNRVSIQGRAKYREYDDDAKDEVEKERTKMAKKFAPPSSKRDHPDLSVALSAPRGPSSSSGHNKSMMKAPCQNSFSQALKT